MNGKSKNLKLASVAGNSNSTENPTVNKTEVTVVSINMLDDEENDQKAPVSNQGKLTAKPVANPTATATAPNSANSSNTSPVSSLFDHGTKAASKPKNVQELANKIAESAPLTNTSQVSAANLGNRSYLLARGAFMPCVLETQLVSNIAGYASCILPQRIYSDDGKVVLLEKGSKIIGQYQNTVKNGDVRIAILWQRIKSATGVVIDVDSPAADGVGAMGAPGYVDNHWMERIGAAFLLSMVDDVIKMEVAKRQNEKQGQNNTVLLPTSSISTSKSLSEKVLESTINIPPTIYKNRGERLMVYVNRDLWFDSVYHIKNLK